MLVLLASGLAFSEPLLVIAGLIPLTFVAYSAATSTSPPSEQLSIDREISPTKPLPGEPVTVTVRVQNVSDWPLSDLRIVDGVPDELYVAEGSIHGATTLRNEGVYEFEYVLRPRRGTFEIADPLVRTRSVSGSAVATEPVAATGDSTIECRIDADNVPIHRQTIRRTGALETTEAGDGTEFHSTREYQLGDPINRIDWRRYARTGELATVQFREEEATTVVLCLDARESSHVSHEVGHPTGATLSAYAAVAAMGALVTDGQRVGVAAFGLSEWDRPRPAWVPPGRDGETVARATEVLTAATTKLSPRADGPSIGSDPPSEASEAAPRSAVADGGSSAMCGPRRRAHSRDSPTEEIGKRTDAGRARPAERERKRFLSMLPIRAQVLYCSPLLDDAAVEDLEAVTAEGYDALVLSPRVTDTGSVGGVLAEARRGRRIAQLRRRGVHVIDWDVSDPLQVALSRALSVIGDRR